MRKTTIVIYKADGGEWRWRMVARNNKIIADSAESYTTKAGINRAVDRLLISDFDVVERSE